MNYQNQIIYNSTKQIGNRKVMIMKLN